MTPADTKEAWRRAMTDLALCKSRRRIAQSREAIRQCETAIEIAKLNVRVAAREHMHAVLDEGIREVLQSESDDLAACSNAARLSSESPSKGSGGDS